MKVAILNIIILIVLILVALAIEAKAQDSTVLKKADFTSWVIESNTKTPKISAIKFYNAKQELIYQEMISGKNINVNRVKVLKKLNEVARLIETNRKITPNNLVAASLKVN